MLRGIQVAVLIVSLKQSISFAPSTTRQPISTRLHSTQENLIGQERRNFLAKMLIASGSILTPQIAIAEEDLTSQLFNADGSLKEGAMNGLSAKELEAKDKAVDVVFPIVSNDAAIVSIDGEGVAEKSDQNIKATYNVPEKWTAAPDYLDTLLSSRERACDRITVYQVPGTFKDFSVLEKATTIGVAKALGFASVAKGVLPKTLPSADIVSGRKTSKSASTKEDETEMRKYYEFDMAVAPDTCGSSAENLGLGFCPYDTIVLLSATIVEQKMMVLAVTCTKDEWKRSNADLKRVRNSFYVEAA